MPILVATEDLKDLDWKQGEEREIPDAACVGRIAACIHFKQLKEVPAKKSKAPPKGAEPDEN